jgi:hypothetical protein
LLFGVVNACLQLGLTRRADQQIDRFVGLAHELRHTGAEMPIAWWGHQRAVATGNRDAARLRTAEAIERHRSSQLITAAGALALRMAEMRVADPGCPVPEEFVEFARPDRHPACRAYVAHLLLEAGRREDALDLLGEPVPDGAWDSSCVYSDCLRVDVLAAAGPSAALSQGLARIRDWGGEFASYGPTDYIGSIEYFIGRGLEGLGDLAGAHAAYERAVEANRSAGVVPWLRRAE